MPTAPTIEVRHSLRRHMWIGLTALILIGGGLGIWGATARLAGAVIAHGILVVDSNVKKVQHPTGGVVGELFVKDGNHVEAGDIVVKLDETQTRANLAVVVNSIDELLARQGRLEAERTGVDTIDFAEDLLARQDDPRVQKLLSGEQKHFELRREAREGQRKQLKERVSQLQEQIRGLTEQIAAKRKEIGLVMKELEAVRTLWDKQLVQLNRITALEREAARLEGEKGQLIAATAEAKGKIAETELQIIQVDQDMRSQVAQEFSDVRAKLAELTERKVAAEDQLKRVDIRAPQSGTVHQLAMHTVGGVIGPGEAIMLIVPDHDKLAIEAKVSPADIDQLRIGQTAALRFSAFNMFETPELTGHLTRIGADLTHDERDGISYYLVRAAVNEGELQHLQGRKLVPGMPVEVFIQTEPRSPISYLLKPLQDQVARAFKDA